MIISFCGLIGSGKDTASNFLVENYGFRRDSFANTLKDAVSAVFGWDRVLLEGMTKEARAWRETEDKWWSNRLGMKITPRWILQQWGTDVCRKAFHDDIWIASLENRLRKTKDDIVISDVRFPNEINAICKSGGIVVRIKRGEDPEWFKYAETVNKGPSNNIGWSYAKTYMEKSGIHASESSWVGGNIQYVVTNDGTVDELFEQIKSIVDRHINVNEFETVNSFSTTDPVASRLVAM